MKLVVQRSWLSVFSNNCKTNPDRVIYLLKYRCRDPSTCWRNSVSHHIC